MKRLLLALVLLGFVSIALAEPSVQSRRMGIDLVRGGVTITYSAADLLQKNSRQKLESSSFTPHIRLDFREHLDGLDLGREADYGRDIEL